jgi:hypothetical protein
MEPGLLVIVVAQEEKAEKLKADDIKKTLEKVDALKDANKL